MKQLQQNKMATMPMGKLVITMALPLMLSMLLQAFYNVVDSLFVSMIVSDTVEQAGDKAMKALTLSLPVQMLMISCNTGTGVGINAVLSRYLGQKDRKSASMVAGNALFLAGCIYVAFLLFGLFGTEAFLRTQTKDADVLNYGVDYLRICMIYSFGAAGTFAFEKVLQATGKTTLSMITQMSGALTNIVLDYGLVLGRLGMPAMGVKGAAIATVIGQCLSLVVGAVVCFGFDREVDYGIRYCRPRGKIIAAIYKIGFPAIVMQSLSSVMMYGMNLILATMTGDLVTPFGVYFKFQSFIFMPAFGLNNALVPIIGFSYGAKQRDRIMEGLRWGLTDGLILMGTGILLIQCFAGQVVGLFQVSEEVKESAKLALRVISTGYLFTGVNIVLQGFCQALGNGVYSLIISLLRMIVVLLPLAWLMAATGHSTAVWASLPIAELAAMVAAIIMARKLIVTRVNKLENPACTLNKGEV